MNNLNNEEIKKICLSIMNAQDSEEVIEILKLFILLLNFLIFLNLPPF